jgi:metal-responsive CopG/Arc/MetJ family transcriptional regulator
MKNTMQRLSVSLPEDVSQLLESLAKSQGITKNEAIRKAIATEAYLWQERLEGSKILLQKADKEVREVLFR